MVLPEAARDRDRGRQGLRARGVENFINQSEKSLREPNS